MADNRKLAYHVHVEDEDGSLQVFGPKDTVPAWARKKITNPSAWADGDSEDTATAVEPEPAAVPADEPDAGSEGDGGDDGDPDEVVEVEDYNSLSAKDLKAEIKVRNADRDDDHQIVVGGKGNKPDLVAALEADDEANGDE